MNQGTHLLRSPVTLTAGSTADRGVSTTGGVPAAGGRCLGPAFTTEASGAVCSVTRIGTAPWEAGAAFAKYAKLEVDAQGRVITLSAGVWVAVAEEAATAAGQKPECLIVAN